MRELTKAEEQIMQVLWQLKKAVVRDVIAKLPEPKPAYNTVSTIIRILETKGFIDHKAYGKTYEYFPIIDQDEYRSFYLKNMLSTHFGGSFRKLVSFFAKDADMDLREVEQLMAHVKEDLPETKNPDGDE